MGKQEARGRTGVVQIKLTLREKASLTAPWEMRDQWNTEKIKSILTSIGSR